MEKGREESNGGAAICLTMGLFPPDSREVIPEVKKNGFVPYRIGSKKESQESKKKGGKEARRSGVKEVAQKVSQTLRPQRSDVKSKAVGRILRGGQNRETERVAIKTGEERRRTR